MQLISLLFSSRHRIAVVTAALLAPLACAKEAAMPVAEPAPSFRVIEPPVSGNLMSTSSPVLVDLDGDHVLDIIFGSGVDRVRNGSGKMVFTGQPDVSGEVMAVSGATNKVLWQVPNPRDAFTTPRLARLNADSVPDVIMGGREGNLSAFDGRNGQLLWRVEGKQLVKSEWPFGFYTPALITDMTSDGVPDVLASYGGDAMRMPKDPRESGYLVVISGADGRVLKLQQLPDSAETYASPVVYQRKDGTQWVVFGTGGETHGGGSYRAPVASLMDSTFDARRETLVARGTKGVMAPPTIVELTGDGEPDLVVSTFDGRLTAVDGATAKPLWEHVEADEEAYHQPAVVRIDANGTLGLFVSSGLGAFPKYVASVHRLYNARDGKVLYEHQNEMYPGGAPLAVDLNGDGIDEPVFFSTRFPSAQGSRIHVLHVPTRTLVEHDLAQNLWSTPVIGDAKGQGRLELTGAAWGMSEVGATADRPALRWELLRLSLDAPVPAFTSWGGYMGTTHDAHYRPPSK